MTEKETNDFEKMFSSEISSQQTKKLKGNENSKLSTFYLKTKTLEDINSLAFYKRCGSVSKYIQKILEEEIIRNSKVLDEAKKLYQEHLNEKD